MRDWLLGAVVGYMLLLVSFVVVVAVLDRDHGRADRAVRVLRLLMMGTVPGVPAAVILLHGVGVL